MSLEKKLYRSSEDKWIVGVCGGLADYWNVNSMILRILWIIFSIFLVGIIFYVVAWLAIPIKSNGEEKYVIPAFRRIPGYRSRTPWKMILATLGYLGVTLILVITAFLLWSGPPPAPSPTPTPTPTLSPTPSPTLTPSPTPTTPTPTPTPSPTISPTPTPTPTSTPLPTIGDRVVVGELAYRVEKVETTSRLGTEFFGTDADGIFLVILLEIENIGTKTKRITAGVFRIQDADGNLYEVCDSAWAYLEESFLIKQLQPNLPTKGAIAFDIPKETGKIYLKVSSGGLLFKEFKLIDLGILSPPSTPTPSLTPTPTPTPTPTAKLTVIDAYSRLFLPGLDYRVYAYFECDREVRLDTIKIEGSDRKRREFPVELVIRPGETVEWISPRLDFKPSSMVGFVEGVRFGGWTIYELPLEKRQIGQGQKQNPLVIYEVGVQEGPNGLIDVIFLHYSNEGEGSVYGLVINLFDKQGELIYTYDRRTAIQPGESVGVSFIDLDPIPEEPYYAILTWRSLGKNYTWKEPVRVERYDETLIAGIDYVEASNAKSLTLKLEYLPREFYRVGTTASLNVKTSYLDLPICGGKVELTILLPSGEKWSAMAESNEKGRASFAWKLEGKLAEIGVHKFYVRAYTPSLEAQSEELFYDVIE